MASIQTNLNALFALRQLGIHNTQLTRALEKLASGYRINRAADDPSGLAIADRLRAHARGYQQASKNIGLASNMVRTAEEGMTQVLDLLIEARDLALESSNTSTTQSDRLVNQGEVDALMDEIDRLATAVRFNSLRLLNGTFSSKPPFNGVTPLVGGGTYIGSAVFQLGPFAGNTIKTHISTLTVLSLGIRNRLLVDSQSAANSNLAVINSVIAAVLSRRARLGGFSRGLSSAQTLADVSAEEHLNAESVIRDADIAAETIEFTKRQILVQAATAMLAQANLLPQNLLALLQFGSSS